MSDSHLPDSVGGRIGWALRESAVLAGVFLAWAVFGVVLVALLGGVAMALRGSGVGAARLVYALANRGEFVWGAVTPLALLSSLLYAVVRAGSLLVDRYRAGA